MRAVFLLQMFCGVFSCFGTVVLWHAASNHDMWIQALVSTCMCVCVTTSIALLHYAVSASASCSL